MNENLIKTNKNSIKAWSIVVTSAIFYCYQFVIRVSPNVMHDDITSNFGIDDAAYGFIVGLYYWGYSLMQLPMGVLMDKIGPRRIITIAILSCALASFIFANTQNLVIASISRLIMGISASSGMMGSLKLGSTWLPRNRMSIVTAITMGFGTIGASLGGTPLRILLNNIGWKNAHNIFAILGIFLSILIYTIVRDNPKNYEINRTDSKNKNIFRGLITILKTPQSWLIAIFGAFMYMPITIMGMAWGVPFLKNAYNITASQAAPITTTMFMGAAVGGSIFAFMSEYLKSRKIPMYVGGIISLIIWIIIVRVSNIPISLIYVLFFLGGFFYTSKILTFAANCEIHDPSYSAVAVGFNSMIVMLMGAISHPFIGTIIELKSKTLKPTFTDYQFALTIVPIFLTLGILILYFMKETYPKSKK